MTVPCPLKIGVCRDTDTDIRRHTPITKVVARFISRFRVIGNLVVPIPRRRKFTRHEVIQIRVLVVTRERKRLPAVVKRRPLLDL